MNLTEKDIDKIRNSKEYKDSFKFLEVFDEKWKKLEESWQDEVGCKHEKCIPDYESGSMSSDEVVKKYPRFDGICPDCGNHVIVYNSFEHYIAGDW